jgi:hypothetical protein
MSARHPLHLALCTVLAALVAPAVAQDAAPPGATTSADGTLRTYAPDFFTRFNPRNALEMLENVPGFVIRAEVVERGLGQATGNVLLNGQRLSGKSNDVLSQVQRIPAGNVVRIEIVDGATLDIPGLSGQVANIVAEAGGISGTWRWRPDVRKYFTDPNLTRFDASVSGAGETIDWTFALNNNSSHSGAGDGGGTQIRNADGTLREERRDHWTGELQQPQLSAQFVRKGESGAVSNLNVSLKPFDYEYLEEGVRTGNPDVADRERAVRSTEVGHNSEIGGDHEFGLGSGRLKLIGLVHVIDSEMEDTVVTDYADATPTDGVRFAREGVETEAIARAEYRWKRGVADWQVSGEYAFNELDSAAELALLGADGEFHPEPLPGSDAVVQEDRVEVMGSYGRPLSAKTTLQVSLGGEYSRLGQAGAGGTTREFVRPKGLVSVAWKASENLDVGLKLERRVGQLNFYDFLASVDINDDQASAGNPDLVPPQTTELQLDTTRRLGAWGTTSLRVYAQRIEDIVDTVPIGDDGEAPGNIDTASVYGFEWKASIELAQIGWKGAKLDTLVQMEHSQVEDPLTGEDRPISNNLAELFEIGLRHDVPDTLWAWGTDVGYSFYEKDYRLTEEGRFWEGPYWGSVYVERKDFHGLTLRLTASNLLDARSKWNRTVYVDRRTGPVDFHQSTDRLIGPIFQISVSGKF